MSASDHLSVEAFRAILDAPKLQQPVGSHWSMDHNDPYAYLVHGVYDKKPGPGPHLIVEAKVNPKDDMPHEFSNANKPLVLKPGSKVNVTSVTKISKRRTPKDKDVTTRYRKRRYNPPREMKA